MYACTDCKVVKATAWWMTDEGKPGTHTAIRCCGTCVSARELRGEKAALIEGDFESAMRGIVRDLSR